MHRALWDPSPASSVTPSLNLLSPRFAHQPGLPQPEAPTALSPEWPSYPWRLHLPCPLLIEHRVQSHCVSDLSHPVKLAGAPTVSCSRLLGPVGQCISSLRFLSPLIVLIPAWNSLHHSPTQSSVLGAGSELSQSFSHSLQHHWQ